MRKDSWGTNATCLLPALTLCGRVPECMPVIVSWAYWSFSPPVFYASPQSFHHLSIPLFYFFPRCLLISMFCCCCLVIKSCLTLAVPWTVACQASLSWDFPARILEWVAISFSRGSSQPRDQARASYIGRQILYH